MKVVIVGGGFAGLKAALELTRRRVGEIVLISERDYFLHHATLYSTATGCDPQESVIELRTILKDYPTITLHIDNIISVDAKKQLVRGSKGTYDYDELILAPGMVDHFYGVNGAKQFSYSSRTLAGVESFSAAFHDMVALGTKKRLACAVVGGGATGVELAGALVEYAKRVRLAHSSPNVEVDILLIERAQRILPTLSRSASRKVAQRLRRQGVTVVTGTAIERMTKSHIVLDGKRVPIDLAVWTCGGTNSPLFSAHSELFRLTRSGQVIVNQYFEAYPHITVIGDSAAQPWGGRASTALANAHFVAAHLSRIAQHRPLRHAPRLHGPLMSIPVSRFWAYTEWSGVYAAGVLGSLVRRLSELDNYSHFLPLPKAYAIWRKHRTGRENCKLCIKQTKIA